MKPLPSSLAPLLVTVALPCAGRAQDPPRLFGSASEVFVAREGEPLAHLITVAPAFIDPERRP